MLVLMHQGEQMFFSISVHQEATNWSQKYPAVWFMSCSHNHSVLFMSHCHSQSIWIMSCSHSQSVWFLSQPVWFTLCSHSHSVIQSQPVCLVYIVLSQPVCPVYVMLSHPVSLGYVMLYWLACVVYLMLSWQVWFMSLSGLVCGLSQAVSVCGSCHTVMASLCGMHHAVTASACSLHHFVDPCVCVWFASGQSWGGMIREEVTTLVRDSLVHSWGEGGGVVSTHYSGHRPLGR